jgi:hypothetical protein
MTSLDATVLVLRIVFLGMWGLFVAALYRPFRQALRSPSWPTTVAVIRSSGVEAVGRVEGVKVVYAYSFNGIDYEGDKLASLGVARFTLLGAMAVAKRYPVGGTVRVHLDPRDPRNSVIIPGVGWRGYVLVVVVTAFCWTGAFMLELLLLLV